MAVFDIISGLVAPPPDGAVAPAVQDAVRGSRPSEGSRPDGLQFGAFLRAASGERAAAPLLNAAAGGENTARTADPGPDAPVSAGLPPDSMRFAVPADAIALSPITPMAAETAVARLETAPGLAAADTGAIRNAPGLPAPAASEEAAGAMLPRVTTGPTSSEAGPGDTSSDPTLTGVVPGSEAVLAEVDLSALREGPAGMRGEAAVMQPDAAVQKSDVTGEGQSAQLRPGPRVMVQGFGPSAAAEAATQPDVAASRLQLSASPAEGRAASPPAGAGVPGADFAAQVTAQAASAQSIGGREAALDRHSRRADSGQTARPTGIQAVSNAAATAPGPNDFLKPAPTQPPQQQLSQPGQQSLPQTPAGNLPQSQSLPMPAASGGLEQFAAGLGLELGAGTNTAAPQGALSAPAAAGAEGTAPQTPQTPQQPAAPAMQVGLSIGKAAAEGRRSFTLRLDPPELGRVDVKLEMAADGQLRAQIRADSRETLDLLQRDARHLERALNDAGLKTDSGSLSFSLNQQGQQAGFGFGRPHDGAAGQAPGGGEEAEADGEIADAEQTDEIHFTAAQGDGIDIRI